MGGCARAPEPRPNVVVIVVDTLRADRLPFYGGPADAAPFLGELAEDSLVFENAWSPSSWTLPATVSVLTSVHPFQHGVSSAVGLELGPDDEPIPVNCIPGEVETLAETLRDAGYRTFGIASNVLVGSDVGFDRGFDRFVMLEDEDADAVNALAASWRDEIVGGAEPFFLYVHYFDPHDTFHAREPWFSPSTDESSWPPAAPRSVWESYDDLDWLVGRLEPQPDWLGGRPPSALSAGELHELMMWMRAAYDSEIGFVDQRIRALYEMYELDEAILFFLADHGEEFFEHGYLTHGQNLYAETVRVPLVLRVPGDDAPRGRVRANVTTLDLVPTLRGLLELPPGEQDQGHDLLARSERRPILAVLADESSQHPLEDDVRALVLGDHKLIAPKGGRAELYDLAADRGEQEDLAGQLPEIVAELQAELERIERSAPVYPRRTRLPSPPSEAMLEHLRGLGYLGGD
jgi:arylsulfatase